MIEELNPFFNTFDPKSKVWIFQADRLLTDKEIDFLTEKGTDFTKQWKAHGADLKAGCTVVNRLFYIFISDETFNAVGGCSIDKLIQFVKTIEPIINVNLLNRLNIAYQKSSEIKLSSLSEIKLKIANNEIDENTIIYNNSVDTIDRLKSEWMLPLNKSFLKKYLKTEAIE